MKTPMFACFALVVSTACASTEGGSDTSKPRQADAKVAKVAISSVQMIEDCPGDDSLPPPPPQPPSEKAASKAVMPAAMEPPAEMEIAAGDVAEGEAYDGGGDFEQPCTQSTMQLSFAGQGPAPANVEIKAVRVLSQDGKKTLAKIEARAPSAWKDGAYQSWDERLAPKSDLKASYKLSVPDWSKFDKKVGGNSYGKMFILEVDVLVGGQKQTVRSSEFPREEPHVIVT